jgi:hypothetical protein
MYASVEVQMLPGRGRGLVTTCHIDAGEVVLAEEPLLLTVLQECKDQACANCLSWLEQRPGVCCCCACGAIATAAAAASAVTVSSMQRRPCRLTRSTTTTTTTTTT